MFTYNFQLAGYPYDKYDEKGELNFNDFIEIFDKFPWLEQLDKYNDIKEGCSATISVQETMSENALWVSIAGNSEKNIFLVGNTYFKTKKTLLGFGREKTIKWVDIYEIQDQERIKQLFKHFFNGETEELSSALLQLKKFDSMEAYS